MKQALSPSPVKRTRGNFLWCIYEFAPRHKQVEFKERLIEAGGGNPMTLWQSFNKVQTIESKTENFNAQIVGIMVQVFCPNDIKMMHELTDLEKLALKFQRVLTGQQ